MTGAIVNKFWKVFGVENEEDEEEYIDEEYAEEQEEPEEKSFFKRKVVKRCRCKWSLQYSTQRLVGSASDEAGGRSIQHETGYK